MKVLTIFPLSPITGSHTAKSRVKDAVMVPHYENTPIQYTIILPGCKNDYFQMKNCDIFLIFAQNIDFGYTLEPPH